MNARESLTGVPATGRFSVLVVCTANICRSPAAEVELRSALVPSPDVVVSSAGLRARVGEPVDPGMVAVLGREPEGFAARQVGPAIVRDADLVLTMTRDQRSAIVGAVPAAVRSTFTLREFAALVGLASEHGTDIGQGTKGERLAALAAVAPRFRSVRAAGDHDDIEDPFGGSRQDYSRALEEIRASVADVVTALEGDRVVPSFADAWSA
ncbi:hypothetical protein [Blastococcus litoris]|uniref:arsenate reductase/protein-tyrosine-phosphatase family protein n=1 Tax=Blastococcus litoris TaxID=2171622 RepID=UPI0019D079A4|nr:hypothetical protein [Blastococcus litoris]